MGIIIAPVSTAPSPPDCISHRGNAKKAAKNTVHAAAKRAYTDNSGPSRAGKRYLTRPSPFSRLGPRSAGNRRNARTITAITIGTFARKIARHPSVTTRATQHWRQCSTQIGGHCDGTEPCDWEGTARVLSSVEHSQQRDPG